MLGALEPGPVDRLLSGTLGQRIDSERRLQLQIRRNSALECVDTLALAEASTAAAGCTPPPRPNKKEAAQKMTDDDGDDDTMEGRLAHILESDAMDTVDLWLTIVACLAAIETLYVCALATADIRGASTTSHSNGGRSAFCCCRSTPCSCGWRCGAQSLDFYLAVPLGFYECYAFFMLLCHARLLRGWRRPTRDGIRFPEPGPADSLPLAPPFWFQLVFL